MLKPVYVTGVRNVLFDLVGEFMLVKVLRAVFGQLRQQLGESRLDELVPAAQESAGGAVRESLPASKKWDHAVPTRDRYVCNGDICLFLSFFYVKKPSTIIVYVSEYSNASRKLFALCKKERCARRRVLVAVRIFS